MNEDKSCSEDSEYVLDSEDCYYHSKEMENLSSSTEDSSALELSTDLEENYANITGRLISTPATRETSKASHMKIDTEQQTKA